MLAMDQLNWIARLAATGNRNLQMVALFCDAERVKSCQVSRKPRPKTLSPDTEQESTTNYLPSHHLRDNPGISCNHY